MGRSWSRERKEDWRLVWGSVSCRRSSARFLHSSDARTIMRKVLFVAGEASGDLHAAGVAAALQRLRPELGLAAVGGSRLAEQGVELIHRDSQLGVMGFLEIVKPGARHTALCRRTAQMRT